MRSVPQAKRQPLVVGKALGLGVVETVWHPLVVGKALGLGDVSSLPFWFNPFLLFPFVPMGGWCPPNHPYPLPLVWGRTGRWLIHHW